MGHPVHSGGMSQPRTVGSDKPSLAAKRAAAPYAARTKRYYQTLSATSVGIELAVSVVLCLFLGMWLDDKLGTAPGMMIGWLVIGFIAGMRAVFRHVAASDRLADEMAEENAASQKAES